MPGWDLNLTVAGDPPSCWWHVGGRRRPSGTDRAPGETAEPAAGSTKHTTALLEVRAGGVVAELRRGTRLAPRILGRGAGGTVRAAFVPTQAGPLAGDHDAARIVVGPGATLVVEPVAATLALPGAELTTSQLEVTVAAGGRLVLDEGPLIVAAGAAVQRRCTIELADGAVAALRETLVLGRDGEAPGTLDSSLRVTAGARPLLHDGLRFSAAPAIADAHVALAPGERVVCTISLLGVRPRAADGVLMLEGPGGLMRATGRSLAAVDGDVEARWRSWSRAAADGGVGAGARAPLPAR